MSNSNIYYVYVYLDPRTEPPEPIYVGKGHGRRWQKHLRKTHNVQLAGKIKHIQEAGLKVLIERPHVDLTCEESMELEKQIIAKYGRKDLGLGTLCNYTDGGEGAEGRKHKPETLELFRQQRRGKPQTPAQYAANCSRVTRDDTREKQRRANKGHRRHTPEQIEAIVQSNETRVLSEETHDRMSDSQKKRRSLRDANGRFTK